MNDEHFNKLYNFGKEWINNNSKISANNIILYPSSELLLDEKNIITFRKNFRKIFSEYKHSQVYNSFSQLILPQEEKIIFHFFIVIYQIFLNIVKILIL